MIKICDMTLRSYFGKMNSILGSVVPLAMFLDKGVRVIPEGALLWEKVLDVPKGHRLCGNLHPVRHWLSFLVREGVHCHSNFTRNSLKKNCQNIPSEFILSNST